MKLKPTLNTDHLVLRKWKIRDLKSLYELCKDEELAKNAGFYPLGNYVDAWIRLVYYYMMGCGYAICIKETGQLAGSITFMDSNESHLQLRPSEVEAGYWIGRPYWGKGYAAEACRSAISSLFEEEDVKTIFCVVDPENTQSHRVQEKLGFRYNRHETISSVEPGKKVSCEVFEITRKEWRFSL